MAMSEQKKFYRARDDRVLGGVLGGLGKYVGIDSNLLRLIYIILIALGIEELGGPLILFYILAWIFIPEEPPAEKVEEDPEEERVRNFLYLVVIATGVILIFYSVYMVLTPLTTEILNWATTVIGFPIKLLTPYTTILRGAALAIIGIIFIYIANKKLKKQA